MNRSSKASISLFEFTMKRKLLSLFLNNRDLFLFRSFYLGMKVNASKELNPPESKPEVKPFKENDGDVWIGPPDPTSNLRLKVFPQSLDLSDEEKNFYSKSKEVQDWNQKYWADHNKDFTESRKLFVDKTSKEKNLPKEESLSPDDMSIFYKDFLDRNRSKHIRYNWNWYRKNVGLIILAAKTKLIKFKKIIRNSVN